MDITIHPTQLHGNITIIPSKSMAHRLLICAAFANEQTDVICPESNRDMDATVDCLRALGADIRRTETGFSVFPANNIPKTAFLPCGESGSTLRFLLPVAGALGVDATFLMEGRLSQRPLSPLWEEMERMGCTLSHPTHDTLRCTGRLTPGDYAISGNISSQYITGLLLALSFMDSPCRLEVTGPIESKPYIDMTKEVLRLFGANPEHLGGKKLQSPGTVAVEGDWSNGAFWLAANALGCSISVSGLNEKSSQGDRAIQEFLPLLQKGISTISAADIPDLVPILSVVAAANHGAVFTDIRRLRLKESDRVESVIAMIKALDGSAMAKENTLTVGGNGLIGGIVDSCNDHRIAMAAAIAATACRETVTILGAECVSKSYPRFWEEYSRLGGNYELYLR